MNSTRAMKGIRFNSLCVLGLGLLAGPFAAAQALESFFDADAEGWTGSPDGVSIVWQEEASNGVVQASFTNNTPWYFSAPASWLGDWSGYRLMSFDLKLENGIYANSNANDIVVIEGANGTNLVWRGPSPYWEWSHYELPLEPLFFGVDQSTFDGVVENVAGIKILGEYKDSFNETTTLDNVVATTNAALIQTELSSTFDSDIEDWRPFDDVTLTHVPTNGNPGGYLHGLDWADGRSYRFKTPLSWAGDWSGFNRLSFDLTMLGSSAGSGNEPVVWIRGGSGETLVWNGPGPQADWTSYEIYLVAENFGVDETTFNRVMRHVTEMLILGEYIAGDEQEGLDNVVLSSAPIPLVAQDLTSSFDNGLEAWRIDGDGLAEWVAGGGNPDGYYLGKDHASGLYWHFVTPEAWKGNWINLTWLKFKLKSVTGATYKELPMVGITGMNGTELWWTGPVPHNSWTPYSLPLTPEAFGTNSVVFNQVMAYVKEMRIYGEFGGGTDRAALDSFGLHLSRPAESWPEQASTFDADMEDWRKLDGITLAWESSGGNPGGFLKGYNDGSGIWHYVSPEAWNGDWTGYQSLRFDHVILAGTNAEWSEPTLYILGANNERLEWKGPEASNDWVRFAVNLSPELFGVDQATYDAVMEAVVEVRIRGEYVYGSESEGLDNVFLSTSPVGGSPTAPVLFSGVSGTQLSITFQTETNVVYGLEATTNLVEGEGWIDLPGKTILGDGGEATIELDLTDPDLPVRHYRLKAN